MGVDLFIVRLCLRPPASGRRRVRQCSSQKTNADIRPTSRPARRLGARCPSTGDMKYGVDLILVEARNQPTRVLSGEGGEVYAATTSLRDDLGHDR